MRKEATSSVFAHTGGFKNAVFQTALILITAVIGIQPAAFAKDADPDEKNWIFTAGVKPYLLDTDGKLSYYTLFNTDFDYSFEKADLDPEFLLYQNYALSDRSGKNHANVLINSPGMTVTFYPTHSFDIALEYLHLFGGQNYKADDLSADVGYTIGKAYCTGGLYYKEEHYTVQNATKDSDIVATLGVDYKIVKAFTLSCNYDYLETDYQEGGKSISTNLVDLSGKYKTDDGSKFTAGVNAGSDKGKKVLFGAEAGVSHVFANHLTLSANYSYGGYNTGPGNKAAVAQKPKQNYETQYMNAGVSFSY